jgi:chromosome partitioning protein
VTLVKEASIYKPTLKFAFAINRKIVNTAIGRDVMGALAEYEEVPILPSAVHQRVAFAESAATGQTVLETAPDGPAAREIRDLVKAIGEFAA